MSRYGPAVKQQIRFCTAPDGVRLAYAVHGRGPPLVRVATWLTHLRLRLGQPGLAPLAATPRRAPHRGPLRRAGLRALRPRARRPSLETWVADLETVVDAAGLGSLRAARHLAGSRDRGRLRGPAPGARQRPRALRRLRARPAAARGQREQEDALLAAIRAGWENPTPTFRHVFSTLFLPDGTPEQMAWYDDLLRASTSAETAVRLFEARGSLDVREVAPEVRAEPSSSMRVTTASSRPRRAGCSPR